MTRLPLVSCKEMCKIFEKIGFVRHHQSRSHALYYHPDGRRTAVPIHGNETLGRGLISEILDQISLSREEYERLRLKI